MKRSIKKGFTIVELLTVMTVIALLIGLLVPSLDQVRRIAKDTKQKAQFHSINVAMDMFKGDWDEYPDSDCIDDEGYLYVGAQILAEAMVGRDLLGMHRNTLWRADGEDNNNEPFYPSEDPAVTFDPETDLKDKQNLQSRREPYLKLENVGANKLSDLYREPPNKITALQKAGTKTVGSAANLQDTFVLCDVYDKVKHPTKGKVGMPILYFKAHTEFFKQECATDSVEDTGSTKWDDDIYNCEDNYDLIDYGIPNRDEPHDVMIDPNSGNVSIDAYAANFDRLIRNEEASTPDVPRPFNASSYILWSAGYDGRYGTADDIFNFSN